MSKQSANRRNKQRQGNGKPAANGTSSQAQTQAKPAQTATKANAAVLTRPAVSAESKSTTSTAARSAQASTKARPAPPSKQASRQQRRTQKDQNRLEQKRIDTRNRLITIFSFAAALVLVLAFIGYFVWRNNAASSTQAQTETVVDPRYQPIDNVYCDSLEQLSYHIHAHLTIYIDGTNVPLAANTGIAPIGLDPSTTTPTCFYWLHTHDSTGIVHIESPTTKTYSLKQFLDIWESFNSSSIAYPTQLSSSTGWTIYVGGKKVNEDFSQLQLTSHEVITIMYNSPNAKPDTAYSFPAGY